MPTGIYYRMSDAERRLRHKDSLRRYRLSHSEKVKATIKAWAKAHPEKVRAGSKAWRLAHPEKARAAYKAWNKANPESRRASRSRRRARKRGLPDTLSTTEWNAILAAYKFKCAYCGKKAKLTQDHIIPLSKGGGTIAHNTIPACQPCNSRKHTGLPPKPVNLVLGI